MMTASMLPWKLSHENVVASKQSYHSSLSIIMFCVRNQIKMCQVSCNVSANAFGTQTKLTWSLKSQMKAPRPHPIARGVHGTNCCRNLRIQE